MEDDCPLSCQRLWASFRSTLWKKTKTFDQFMSEAPLSQRNEEEEDRKFSKCKRKRPFVLSFFD